MQPETHKRGVPVDRTGDTFETFDLSRNPGMAKAIAQCRKVANGDHWCALLLGPYGTGKSHLAIAAMNGYGFQRSYFWKTPRFLTWIKRRAFDEGEPIDEVIKPYAVGRFLFVLDDLGAENSTDWAMEQLYSVLDSRYDASLPTIITSNELPEKLDGRILSRFNSGLVVCAGKDLR